MKEAFKYYILLLVGFTLFACSDDLIDNPNEPFEGQKALVDIETRFYPFSVASLETRSTDGDAIDEINNLFVAFYGTESSEPLKFSYYYDRTTGLSVNALPDREIGGDDNDPICEGTVKQVQIPTGTYYIIAVANMGNLATSHASDIATLDKIRKISFPWIENNIPANNQMSGFFTPQRTSNPPHTLEPEDKPDPVEIKSSTKSIHAWLRRAASKVTVSFDGSKLNQNVWVYIRSIKLKDIPKNCLLVNKNQPTASTELELGGDSITFGPWNDYTGYKTWPTITNGTNTYLTDYMQRKNPHARDSKASLFFFENMQGGGKENGFKLKHQIDTDDPDHTEFSPTHPNGYKPTDDYWKDCVPYGTYVEVEGFYESQAGGNHAKGKIIYRFMLGKDVDYDYNAERNYHYKLTLVFKGNANDVDWHIEYKEDDGYWAPSPFYISYLYNKDMYLPIQTQGRVARIEAKIIRNDWFPSGETDEEQEDLEANNVWDPEVGGFPVYWSTPLGYTSQHKDPDEIGQTNGFGFLSLRYEGERAIEMTNNEFNQNGASAPQGAPYIDEQYHTHQLYKRTYYNPFIDVSHDPQVPNFRNKFLETSTPNKYAGVYMIEDETLNENPRHVFKIPFYTRALMLMTTTSHTGNSPFFNYVRKAKVRIQAFNDRGELVQAYDPTTGERKDFIVVEIIQVRRIVNPKGIFRHSSNAEQFHVVLKERKGDINDNGTPTSYEATISHGAWTAKIIAGEDWIRIGKNSNPTSTRVIYGDTETPIDFYVKPAGTIGATQQRHGLIEVSYNNNTCFHTIVVKQGYAPTQVLGGRSDATPQALWSNFNMRSKTKMCESPLEEGSYFRAGKVDDPIDSKNAWNMQVKGRKQTFTLYPSGSKTWANIGTNSLSTSTESLFDNWTYADDYGTYHVAELQDFFYLRNNRETAEVSTDIEISYGIVYGDGATECLDNVDLAHGYTYESANTSGTYPTSVRGMRGCIAYNNGSVVPSMGGNCVFFPSGVTGYGTFQSDEGYGNMRYGGPSKPITSNMDYRPILHRLDLNMGMIYWHRRYEQTGFKGSSTGYTVHTSSAWDFNMTTFDFNTFYNNGNTRANLVRMVRVINSDASKYKPKVVVSSNRNTKCFPNYNY